MTIIQITKDEVLQIVPLFDAYRVWYGKDSDTEGALRFLTDRMEREESVLYGARNDSGEFVGFTQLYPLFSSTRLGRVWLLNDLYVDPDYRGKGISKQLINQAKTLCRKTKAVGMMLETEKTNDIGNNLYPGTGFVLDHEFNHYFWKTM